MKLLNGLMTFTILGASSATGLGIGYLSRGERETQKGYIVSVEPLVLLPETVRTEWEIDENANNETSCKEKNGHWIPKTEGGNDKACYTPKNPKQPSPPQS